MKKTLRLIDVNCPLCDSHRSSLKYRFEPYAIRSCAECGLAYLSPRPDDDEIDSLYDEAYFEGEGFDESVDYKAEFTSPSAAEVALQKLKLGDVYYLLRRTRPELSKVKPRLLDVGCGYGLLLRTASDLGFAPEGLELCAAVGNQTQERTGFPVHTGSIVSLAPRLPAGSYDVITMVEVLEHLVDPVQALVACRRLLKPGGVLFLQTGNISSVRARLAGRKWDYFTLPGHVCYYSPPSMRELMLRSGFSENYVCPPRLHHENSKAYSMLRKVGLLDAASEATRSTGKFVKTAVNQVLGTRERLLSPGLFAFGVR